MLTFYLLLYIYIYLYQNRIGLCPLYRIIFNTFITKRSHQKTLYNTRLFVRKTRGSGKCSFTRQRTSNEVFHHTSSTNVLLLLTNVMTFIFGRWPREARLRHMSNTHDGIIKWKNFPRYKPFVRGIHRSQRPGTRSFDVFFDLRLQKLLCKQSLGWWFETQSRPLWRHNNGSAGKRKTDTSVISTSQLF